MVTTTNTTGGWLRKNGAPYSQNMTMTEYFDWLFTFIARALAPTRPAQSEKRRQATLDKILRTYDDPEQHPAANVPDDIVVGKPVRGHHVADVVSPDLGRLRMADIEEITPERAASIAKEIATHVLPGRLRRR